MGTNYYATPPACPNPCAHCSAPDEIHVGKSLVMFQGYETSPWGPIRSWQDWKRILTHDPRPNILDEYGVAYTTEEFVAAVEATSRPARRRQYEWVIRHCAPSERDWLDDDHFSFTSSDFT